MCWLNLLASTQAMGNYPYASSYILNGVAKMPAFPMRVACSYLAEPGLQGADLLSGLSKAVGVFYNATGAHCSAAAASQQLLVLVPAVTGHPIAH